jgi:autotransporter translocation and assembly factor TamB
VDQAELDTDTGELAAVAHVTAAAPDALALAGEWAPPEVASNWRGDVDAQVTALRRVDGRWSLSASGQVGGATVVGVGEVGGGAPTGRVRVAGVNPSRIWAAGPEADVDARVTASADEVTVVARGSYEDIEVQQLTATGRGTLRAGTVEAELTTSRGIVRAEADLVRREDAPILVKRSHVVGDVTELVRHFDAPAMQSVRVDARASGPVTDLTVGGTVDVTGLRDGTTRIARARLVASVPHVSVEDEAPRLAGTLRLTASGIGLSGQRLGRLSAAGTFRDDAEFLDVRVDISQLGFADEARGRVKVTRASRHTKVALGDIAIATGDLTWTGSGGGVDVYESGRVDVASIELASRAGTVRVGGRIDAKRARRAEGKMTVELIDFDLAVASPAIASVTKMTHPRAGEIDLRADVSRRGRAFELDGTLAYSDFVWQPGAPPARGSVTATLGGGTLIANVQVRPQRGKGSIVYDVESSAPRDTLDVDAWRTLDLDDIVASKLVVADLDTDLIEAFGGVELPIEGAGGGTIDFPYRGERVVGIDVDVHDVTTPWLDDLAASVRWTWSDRALTGHTQLDHGDAPVIAGTIGVSRGFQDLWSRPLADFATAQIKAEGDVRDFDLTRLRRAGLIVADVEGRFDSAVVVSGTFERPRVEVEDGRATGLRVAGIDVPRLSIEGEWEGTIASGTVRAEQSNGASLIVDAGYSWGEAPGMTGHIRSKSFELTPLRVLATNEDDPLAELAGVLDADVRVSGTPAKPKLIGAMKVRKLAFVVENGARRLDQGQAVVTFKDDRALLSSASVRSGDGLLEATGSVFYVDRSFTMAVETEKFPVAIGPYIANIDARGVYSGKYVEGGLVTEAAVEEGEVRLADTGRELQNIGALEDVIYVERIGGRQRTDAGPTDSTALPISVVIQTTSPIRVKSPEIDVYINVSLVARLRGRLTYLKGVVSADRGNVELFSRNYNIAKAEAKFDGRVPVDPDLSVELWRTFPTAYVSIEVNGTLSDPRISFSSDVPEYDDMQVLAIVLGQDPEETDNATVPPQQHAAGAVANVLAGRIRETLKIPIDVVRTYPDGYELGKWIGERVLVGYRYRNTPDATKNESEGTVEWRLRRNMVFEGFYGNNSVGGADILYIIRF